RQAERRRGRVAWEGGGGQDVSANQQRCPEHDRSDAARTTLELRSGAVEKKKKRKIEGGTEMPLLRPVPLCRQGRGDEKKRSERSEGRARDARREIGHVPSSRRSPLHLSRAALFWGSVRWRPWRS
ncbi:hypothetical protein IscW_ISCW023838, partial [Ixodes scapularis]